MHLADAWESNHRDWTLPGFQAIVVYRLSRWQRTVRPRILSGIIFRVLMFLYRFIRNVYAIELPFYVEAGRRLHIAHQGGIAIHPRSIFGDNCLIRQNVTIGATGAGDWWRQGPKFGNRVEVGAGAVIVGNITIGDDVKIGPNTVVLSDVPANSVVIGNPSRIIPAKTAPPSSQPVHSPLS